MLDEATTFPASKFKDQVDSLSGAFNRLFGATVFSPPEEFVRMPVMRATGLMLVHELGLAITENRATPRQKEAPDPLGALNVFAVRRQSRYGPR